MNRKQMQANVGKIVAYVDHITGAVLPARVLDARLWEMHYGPERCVRLSHDYRANRGSSGIKIGYPMLMPMSGVRRTPAQQKRMEQWLADTTLTMDDLFDENGEDTGILEAGTSRTQNEGVIFRVVFPKDAREGYEGVVREQRAKNAALKAEMEAALQAENAVRRSAVKFSNTLARLGFKSPDKHPIVAHNASNVQRVSIEVAVLEELINVALPYLAGCDGCGKHDHLLPHEDGERGPLMLCVECHPRCKK